MKGSESPGSLPDAMSRLPLLKETHRRPAVQTPRFLIAAWRRWMTAALWISSVSLKAMQIGLRGPILFDPRLTPQWKRPLMSRRLITA